MAALLPGTDPLLEVQVRARRVAGRADRSEALADAHVLALRHRGRARLEVHERVPVGAVSVGLDHVVAGAAGLVVDGGDGARARGDEWRALVGADVLALVDVVAAVGAEAAVGTAVVVGAGERGGGGAGRGGRRRGRGGGGGPGIGKAVSPVGGDGAGEGAGAGAGGGGGGAGATTRRRA